MCKFENEVKQSLDTLNIDFNSKLRIGVAVSGGADSVSLLLALSSILSEYNLPLFVITVNHNIRPENETAGDAEYVKKICDSLKAAGKKIECSVFNLERGKVVELAEIRKSGIEESARFLRYECFNQFIQDNELDYLCLAHNKNDQLETILMRFLQGGTLESMKGIMIRRGHFIRPMLNISRNEIEDYLNRSGISWRTDSTNSDTQYLRNKIRLNLVPVLDENFPGWQQSLLNARTHFDDDYSVISEILEAFKINEHEGIVSFPIDVFLKQPKAIQIRILIKAENMAGETNRIPYDFLEDLIKSIKESSGKSFKKYFHSVEITIKNNALFIKKLSKSHTELDFFDIIEETGSFLFPFGNVNVFMENERTMVMVEKSGKAFEMNLPFIVRSARLDDEVEMSEFGKKKIADVYSDWHVDEDSRCLIPLFQELSGAEQKIKCVIGSVLGYKDWIVRV